MKKFNKLLLGLCAVLASLSLITACEKPGSNSSGSISDTSIETSLPNSDESNTESSEDSSIDSSEDSSSDSSEDSSIDSSEDSSSDSSEDSSSSAVTSISKPMLRIQKGILMWKAQEGVSYEISYTGTSWEKIEGAEYDLLVNGQIGATKIFVRGYTDEMIGKMAQMNISVEKIETPVITDNGDTVSWNSSNGNAYEAAWDGAEFSNIDGASMNKPTVPGIYTIQIRAQAYAEGSSIFVASEESEIYTFTVKPATPVLTVNAGIVTWEKAQGAISEYKVNGGGWKYVSGTTLDLATLFTESGTLQVRVTENNAVSDPAVQEVTFTKIATAEKATVSGDKFVWTAAENAHSYEYSVNGGEWIATSVYEWRPTEIGVYTIRVRATAYVIGANFYTTSDPSEESDTIIVKAITPTLSVNNAVISWTMADNNTYEVKVGSGEWTANTTGSVDCTGFTATTEVAVRAKQNGAYSDPATQTITVVTLEKPVITENEGVLHYAVANGNAYEVTLNGVTTQEGASVAKATAVGNYSYTVKAIGYASGATVYLTSEASEAYEYAVQPAAPVLTVNNAVISWTAEEGAAYEVKVGGGEWTANTTGSVDATAFTETTEVAVRVKVNGVYSDPATQTITVVTLEKPVITESEGVLHYAVANGNVYEVTVNGTTTQEGASVAKANTVGNYSYTVKAIGYASGAIVYLTSEASEVYTFTVALSAPVLTVNNAVISWTVEEGVAYEVKVGDGEWTANTTGSVDCTNFTATTVVSVKAIFNSVTSEAVKKTITVVTLEKPVITESEGVLHYEVANGNAYEVTLNGATTQEGASVAKATAVGNYSYTVKALGYIDGATIYLASEASEAYEYTVQPAAPVLTVNNAVISWTAEEGAAYEVKVGGGEWTANTTGNVDATAFTETTEVAVRVKVNGVYSDPATQTITVVQLVAPVVTISGNAFVWTAVENANVYELSVNGGEWTATTAMTWTPETWADYTAQVRVNGYANGATVYLGATSAVSEAIHYWPTPVISGTTNVINWTSEVTYDSITLWIDGVEVETGMAGDLEAIDVVVGGYVSVYGKHTVKIEAIKSGASFVSNEISILAIPADATNYAYNSGGVTNSDNKTIVFDLDQTKFKKDGTKEYVDISMKMMGTLVIPEDKATAAKVFYSYGWALGQGPYFDVYNVGLNNYGNAFGSDEWVDVTIRLMHYHDSSSPIIPLTSWSQGAFYVFIKDVEIDYTTISESTTSPVNYAKSSDGSYTAGAVAKFGYEQAKAQEAAGTTDYINSSFEVTVDVKLTANREGYEGGFALRTWNYALNNGAGSNDVFIIDGDLNAAFNGWTTLKLCVTVGHSTWAPLLMPYATGSWSNGEIVLAVKNAVWNYNSLALKPQLANRTDSGQTNWRAMYIAIPVDAPVGSIVTLDMDVLVNLSSTRAGEGLTNVLTQYADYSAAKQNLILANDECTGTWQHLTAKVVVVNYAGAWFPNTPKDSFTVPTDSNYILLHWNYFWKDSTFFYKNVEVDNSEPAWEISAIQQWHSTNSKWAFMDLKEYAGKKVTLTLMGKGTAPADVSDVIIVAPSITTASGAEIALKTTNAFKSMDEWTKFTLTFTVPDSGMIYFTAGNWTNSTAFDAYVQLVSVDTPYEAPADAQYTTTSKETGYWNAHESTFELDFGAEYANKTVCITMNVKGSVTEAYMGTATGFGCYNGDALSDWAGFRAIDTNALLRSNGTWTTITVPNIKLNKDGKAKFGASNGSSAGSITTGAYTICVKDVVEVVEAVWGESKTGWYDENGVKNDNNGATLIPINFGDASIAHGTSLIVSMQVKGTASATVNNGLKASFYSYYWAMNNGDGGFVEVVEGDLDAALRQNEEFKTVVLKINVTTNGVAYLNCSWALGTCTENHYTAAMAAGGYSATVKDVAIWVDPTPEHDYKSSTTGWAGNFFELDFSDVEGVEAESKVTFKMDILGEITSDGTTTIGFTTYTGNNSGTHRGYYAFNNEIRSGEWHTVEITLQLNEAKKIWLAASRTSNSGTNVAYTIYIKNVQFVEVIPEHDYKTSTTSWAGNFVELDFSNVEGVEAEAEITFKLDIFGKVAADADSRTSIGFTSYTASSNGTHRGYFTFTNELKSGEWHTVEITLKLNADKKIFLAASRTGNTGNNVAFTVYVKNVQFVKATAPDAPVLTVNNAVISWTMADNTTYEVKVGSGEWTANTTGSVDATAFTATTEVAVRAKQNGAYSDPATQTITVVTLEKPVITETNGVLNYAVTNGNMYEVTVNGNVISATGASVTKEVAVGTSYSYVVKVIGYVSGATVYLTSEASEAYEYAIPDYDKLGYNHAGNVADKTNNKAISLGLDSSKFYYGTNPDKAGVSQFVNVTMKVQGNLAADFTEAVGFTAYGWGIDNGYPGQSLGNAQRTATWVLKGDLLAAFKADEWVEITIRVPHYNNAGVVLVPGANGYKQPLTVYVKDITVDYGTITEAPANPIMTTVTRKTNVASDTTNQAAYIGINQNYYYKVTDPSKVGTMQWTNMTLKIRGNLASDFTGAVGFFCFGWAIDNGLKTGATLVTNGDLIREAMKSSEWTTITIRFPKYHDTNLYLVPITSAEADYDLVCDIIVVEIDYTTVSESSASPYIVTTTGNGNSSNNPAITKTKEIALEQSKFKSDGTLEWVNMTIKMKGDLDYGYNQATALLVWGWAVNNGLNKSATIIDGNLTTAMKSAEWVTLTVRVPHYYNTNVFFVPITGTNLGRNLNCYIQVVEIDYTTISESATSWTPPEAPVLTVNNAVISWTMADNTTYEVKVGSGEWTANTTGSVDCINFTETTVVAVRAKANGVYSDEVTQTIEFADICAIRVTAEKEALTFVDKITSAGDLTVATAGATYSDVTVAWTSNSDYAVVNGGTITWTLPAEDTEVVLTATITCGDVTETKEFSVQVFAAVYMPSTSVAVTFDLGANGSATHSDGSAISAPKSYTADNYTLTFSALTKVYGGARDAKGNSCLKLGTSSDTASLTFTVGEDVGSVVIYVAKYKTNATKVNCNGTQYTIATSSNDGEYTGIEIDTTTTKKITLATVSGGIRAMIDKIVFYVPGSPLGVDDAVISWVKEDGKEYEVKVGSGEWTANTTGSVDCTKFTETTVVAVRAQRNGVYSEAVTQTITVVQLEKPVITERQGALNYAVTNGKVYEVTLNGEVLADVTGASVAKATEVGQYSCTVKAIGYASGATVYLTSEESAAYEYTVEEEVGDTPSLSNATLSFADTANRTVCNSNQQVWVQNGITVTNDKAGSSTPVADYSNPARFYAKSQLTIEGKGMTKIEFVCNSSSYATALKDSITTGNGVTVSVSGSKVTVTFAAAVDSFSFTLGAQVRMNSLTVNP